MLPQDKVQTTEPEFFSWDYLFIHAMLSTSSIAKKPYLNEYTAKYAFSTTQTTALYGDSSAFSSIDHIPFPKNGNQ